MASPQQLECPTQQELTQFLLGGLADPALESLADHLETCETCRQRLETLEQSGDSLLRQLRTPKPTDPFANEPQCQRILALETSVIEAERSATEQAPVTTRLFSHLRHLESRQ